MSDPGIVPPLSCHVDAPLTTVERHALLALVAASGDADRFVSDVDFPPLLRAALYAVQRKGCAIWTSSGMYRPTAKGRRIATGQR